VRGSRWTSFLRAPCLTALGLLAGCASGLAPSNTDPATADDNPCLSVSLTDGLADSGELRPLWRCLNLHRGFDELEGLVDSVEVAPTRRGTPAEQEVARLVNAAAGDAGVVDWIQQASHLLQEQDAFLLHVVHTVAEWSFGRPWVQIEGAFATADGGPFAEPGAIAEGMVAPLPGWIATLSGAVLDGDRLDPLGGAIAELTAMPQLASGLDALARMVEGDEAVLFADMPVAWAAYFEASVGPGGDTLVPVVEAMLTPSDGLGGRHLGEAVSPPLEAILADPVTRPAVVDALGVVYGRGHLDELTDQLHRLTVMDAAGGPLSAGELSALESLLALMALADGPVDCFVLEVDNLAEFLLQTVASWNPDNVAALIELSAGLVQLMADLGAFACSGVDPALGDRARALVRLAESGALQALIPLLDALYADGHDSFDRIPEVVDVLGDVHRSGAGPSLAAHGREVLDGAFLARLLAILGAWVAPSDPAALGDVHDLLDVLQFLVAPRQGERPLLLIAEPALRVLATHGDEIADWLLGWAELLEHEGSESNEFFEHLAPLLAIDPDLDFLATLGGLLGDPATLESLMLLAEAPGVMEAVIAPAPDGGPGPVGLLGRIAADGSLQAVLALLTWASEMLDRIGLLEDT